ncbi:hypothetical protein [Paeniglutamicibacter sp. Y32M11]|uniref:hypothetical protein n=1 Tax=Paeniglutamicibacter sp. Y32M11 TaxID=2853258 RepID=UPI001C52D0D6|nr:hypothetical protein [Paeniglutamicibacter sp. Y32M11]QXQ09712.1 hypothetical protein KUF55_14815 [Paeniglutamicibacter sp. Y32M11]
MSALVATLTSTFNSIEPTGASMMAPAPNAVCLSISSMYPPGACNMALVFSVFTWGDSISIQTLLVPAGISCVKVISSADADVAVNPVAKTAPLMIPRKIGFTLRRFINVLRMAIVFPQGLRIKR